MSKREARALKQSFCSESIALCQGRLRSGRVRTKMSDGATDAHPRRRSATPRPQDLEDAVGEQSEMTAILPEVVTPSETDVHQLLEQVARMRELLRTKEAELAEVKSELTFMRGEIETAREEADIVRRQAETTQEEVETVTSRMTVLERESHTVCLEVELDKLREMESLRREFDAEQRQLRQDCERDAREFKEWRKELTSERDHLRAYVEQLREEPTDNGDHDVHSDDITSRQKDSLRADKSRQVVSVSQPKETCGMSQVLVEGVRVPSAGDAGSSNNIIMLSVTQLLEAQ